MISNRNVVNRNCHFGENDDKKCFKCTKVIDNRRLEFDNVVDDNTPYVDSTKFTNKNRKGEIIWHFI